MSELMGDMIIFNPMLYEQMKENPFKLEEREFPVNFAYPRNYTYMYQYKIPEGYELESMPKQIKISSQDQSLHFINTSTLIGNIINVTVISKIAKDVFLPTEYEELKEFYNLVVAKQAEQSLSPYRDKRAGRSPESFGSSRQIQSPGNCHWLHPINSEGPNSD